MSNKFTFLVCPIDAVGHVNGCKGVTRELLANGHRVVFFVGASFRGSLQADGFEEWIYENDEQSIDDTNKLDHPAIHLSEQLFQKRVIGPYPVEEKWKNLLDYLFFSDETLLQNLKINEQLKKVIEIVKPDLIFVDNGILLPAIYYSGVPWIKVISTAPLCFVYDDNLPPPGLGIPYVDKESIASHRHLIHNLRYSKKFSDYVEKMGYERYPDDLLLPETQLMTIYAYPEEINYPEMNTKKMFNLEVFDKIQNDSNFKLSDIVPESFLADNLDGKFSGKLIYVSLGSMGSIDLNLMKRLVDILSKTSHKYIVSKGPKEEQYDLSRNMWGKAFLPQTKILPFVDLVITHGGNNTITETFARGKKMLIMPLFADQFDNAQRLVETHYGLKLDPYNFEPKELIDSIDYLVNDDDLQQKMKIVANRIQTSKKNALLLEKIEQLCHHLANK